MQAFTELQALAVPLEGRNIDTDQIIPARFLKKNRDALYKNYLFHDLRVDSMGQPRPECILNQPAFDGAQILVADENFGCGSSREGAVYCLADYGIRAILAPSFGDIFFNNCLKNGLLPVRLNATLLSTLRGRLLQNASEPVPSLKGRITIDLVSCSVRSALLETTETFDIEPFWRECLLKGADELTLTLGYASEISTFEQQHYKERPWLGGVTR